MKKSKYVKTTYPTSDLIFTWILSSVVCKCNFPFFHITSLVFDTYYIQSFASVSYVSVSPLKYFWSLCSKSSLHGVYYKLTEPKMFILLYDIPDKMKGDVNKVE
jgi:hypothetical protein